MVFTQPFLFTADLDTRKDVRSLLMDFAKHLSKQLHPETLLSDVNTLTSGMTEKEASDATSKFLQKQCTSKVRKYFNRKCRPQTMTACRLFQKEHSDEIREKSGGDFIAYNKVKAEMWNAVKADKDQIADYTTRAAAFNVEHNLNVKKTKRRTGYLTFTMSARPEVVAASPDMILGDISKELGKMWRKLSETERKEWNDRAKNVVDDSVPVAEQVVPVKKSKKSKSEKKERRSKKAAAAAPGAVASA
jgi:hypothetical protein